MNQTITIPKPHELNDFIEFLFSGLDGYMYIIAKIPDDAESWDQVFFEYPSQVGIAIKAIERYRESHEIYIAPVLYKSKRAVKETFKCSQVLWCDFDGNTPDSFDIPPSLVIRSSEEGHNHVYWRMDEPTTDSNVVEEYNRRLTFKYNADASGWDATQVLRPPYTTNHKRGGLNVYTEQPYENLQFNLAVFDDLAPAPEKSVDYGLWEKMDLPNLNDVIYANKFGPDFKNIFEKQKNDVSDRSASLTNVAFICAEAGLTDKEIYVIIGHLANRWEKFKHHTANSRARQLLGIIEHARIKFPNTNFSQLDEVFEYSPKTLLETEIEVEWAIPGMLMRNGTMLFSGQSGIGKSQFAMQVMAHMAMGENFMNYEIDRPRKVGFFSLEMGDMEVKHFLQTMYPYWTQLYSSTAIDLLNENLKIIPFGEALPLNTSTGQNVVLDYIENNDWEGIFIDSVGSAVVGNINSSETIQPFTNFNDKIRKRYNMFLWYIHHFRKPPPGQKSHGGQEDVYGDQYLTAKATSVYTIVKGPNGLLKIRNPKNRHAKEETDYLISRDDNMFFTHQGEDNENPDPLDAITKQVTKKSKFEAVDLTPKPFQ